MKLIPIERRHIERINRDETDRGALMICDPRLVEKPYGKRIWRALPPFRRTRSLADVEAFFTAAPARSAIPQGTP